MNEYCTEKIISPPMKFDNQLYTDWVDKLRTKYSSWLRNQGDLGGLCVDASYLMADNFHELAVVGGEVYGVGHWWCVRITDGAIIDPTACQFFTENRHPKRSEYIFHSAEKCGIICGCRNGNKKIEKFCVKRVVKESIAMSMAYE